MRKSFSIRIIYNVSVFVSVLFLPWWVPATLCVFGIVMFSKYYECVAFGTIMDLLYGMETLVYGVPIVFTLASFVLFILNRRFKSQVRIYG